MYDATQQALAGDGLLNALKYSKESAKSNQRNEVYSAFQQIAAVLKHPRFVEERECRMISTE